MIHIDARGQACPIPVVKAKKALDQAAAGEMIEVLVDNEAAVQNLRKLAGSMGCDFSAQTAETGHFVTVITSAGLPAVAAAAQPKAECRPDSRDSSVVVIRSAVMGQGDDELGKVLMKGYIFALSQLETLPAAILFYNGGVTLTTEGSDSLEDLNTMAAQGVNIISCGTCLNYYGLTDRLQAGTIGNMYELAGIMQNASKIISP